MFEMFKTLVAVCQKSVTVTFPLLGNILVQSILNIFIDIACTIFISNHLIKVRWKYIISNVMLSCTRILSIGSSRNFVVLMGLYLICWILLGSSKLQNYPFGIVSMTSKRDCLQKGEMVKFQLCTIPQTGQRMACNVVPQRRALVECVKDQVTKCLCIHNVN